MRKIITIYLCLIISIGLGCTGNSERKSGSPSPYLQESDIALSPPKLNIDSILFKTSSRVAIDYGVENAEIYYSIDKNPFEKYIEPLEINHSCVLHARAELSDFQPSQESIVQLIQLSEEVKIKKIETTPSPNEKYPGDYPYSLSDLTLGSEQFNKDVAAWCGYRSDTLIVDLHFSEVTDVKRIFISTLLDQASWIFSPQRLEVVQNDIVLGSFVNESETKSEETGRIIQEVILASPLKSSSIKVRIISLDSIPLWHPGKGLKPWVFIDEIIVQ